MIELLAVCTANICRSPLAEGLLRTRLAPLSVSVSSAGTRGMTGREMTTDAAHLARRLGVAEHDVAAHRGRLLTESDLESPDLILAMTRDHRREIAGLAPSRLRSTFTIREFARLAGAMSDADLASAARAAGEDPSARLRGAAVAVAALRGLLPALADPADDDVVDPYGRPWEVYQLSAAQMLPAVDEVVRVVRLVVAG